MGVGTEMACNTCKKYYYCGYGSYQNHEYRLNRSPCYGQEGHEVITWDNDYTHQDAEDKVWFENPFDSKLTLIADIKGFEVIDLDPTPS